MKSEHVRPGVGAVMAVIVAMFLTFSASAQVPAAEERPDAAQVTPLPEDGPGYPVSAFELAFLREHPSHPLVIDLLAMPIQLGWTSQGYVAPRADVPPVTITLSEAAIRPTETYYASALQHILVAIKDELVAQDLMGVYVAPDPSQIEPSTGKDLRAGNTTLVLVLTTGIVTQLRTMASGERVTDDGPIKSEERINHPWHAHVIEFSPLQPWDPDAPEGAPRVDLLNKAEMDRYLFFLSRHPGRRVDAALAAGVDPGTVSLDYQVTENKPLVLYAQISNTGTQSTGYMRYRFGFFHSQLTNNDDILSFDYITSFDSGSNQILASYEAPVNKQNDRWRWRVYGGWSQYTADQVGFFGQDFTGEDWNIGGELIWNFYQKRELFFDTYFGARFENVQTENTDFGTNGDSDFGIPRVGVRMDQTTEWFSTQGFAQLEFWLSDSDAEELELLGRTDPSTDPTVFQGGLTQSVYLEPLLNRAKWEDPSDPKNSTLSHELFMSIRGQYAFGDRLIPNAQAVAGGLYTVRGYPESAVAGDSAVIGTAEYRYHIPRAFDLEPEPRELFGQPFRAAPQYVYGRPDWDFVLKAFLDAGAVYQSDIQPFESDETLVGVGVGCDLVYRRNLTARLDWGFALTEIPSIPVNVGSNRLQFVVTILY
jgi:hemolysin activation/secretion protein